MKKQVADSYEGTPDEELMLRLRMGDVLARDALVARFYAQRHPLSHAACPTITPQLNDWDINDAFFHAYLNAESSYQFGRVPFRAFLIKCLSSSLINLFKSIHSKSNNLVTNSLDDPLNRCDDSDFTLNDVVAEEGTLDDPKAFMNYAETLKEFTKLPKGIDPITIDIVKLHLDGYSVREAAEKLGLPIKRASYLFSRYTKWAKSVLEKQISDSKSTAL